MNAVALTDIAIFAIDYFYANEKKSRLRLRLSWLTAEIRQRMSASLSQMAFLREQAP